MNWINLIYHPIPSELVHDKTIVKAIEVVDRMFNEAERQVYETRMQALLDIESKIISAWDKGMKEGMEQGIEQGIEVGKKWEQLKIAQSLLDILDLETVALKTGLSIEEIAKLK